MMLKKLILYKIKGPKKEKNKPRVNAFFNFINPVGNGLSLVLFILLSNSTSKY